MRKSISIPLAFGVLACCAVTASAGDGSGRPNIVEFHARHHENGRFRRGGFVPQGIPAPGFLEEGAWDAPYETGGISAIPSAPQIVIQAPRRPEADERPTVEMTPSGVQIVRGPGSHHIDRP